MFTKAEQDQMTRELIADSLIDDDRYFEMTDPNPFLDWAVKNIGDFTDLDNEGDLSVNFDLMLTKWVEGARVAA